MQVELEFPHVFHKIAGHPEQAPRGRRRGGAQSKDPVEGKTNARTTVLLSRDASTAFRPRLRPRRNSAQHDFDFESENFANTFARRAKKILALGRSLSALSRTSMFKFLLQGLALARPYRFRLVGIDD